MPHITEEKFHAYEAVRRSGVTNMFDLPMVSLLSGLSHREVLLIMKEYGAFQRKFSRIHTA